MILVLERGVVVSEDAIQNGGKEKKKNRRDHDGIYIHSLPRMFENRTGRVRQNRDSDSPQGNRPSLVAEL